MNIKIFQHFHINNNQEKLTFNKNPLDTNIETDDTTLKTTSDAISAIGRASVSFQAKKISPEIAKTIIQKSKEGISIEDIVLLLGGIVSASAITTLLDKHAKTEQIIELYKNGESFAEIGKKVDCSSPTVRHYLEELDNWEELRAEHNARLNKQTFSPDLINEMIELYKQGKTFEQIAEIKGCNIASIHKHLHRQENWEEIKKEHNQNSDKKFILKDETNSIIKYYKQGKPIAEIATLTGFSTSSIQKQIQEQPNLEEIEAARNKAFEKQAQKLEQQIIGLYKEGVNTKEIQKKLKCSNEKIKEALLHQENLDELKKIHKKNSKLNHISQEEKNKMGELYSKGYTIGQIAKEFNRGTTSVHDNLHKLENWEEIKAAHDKVIEENFISEETLSKIEKDFRQGKSYSELFHTFNLAAGTIAERLQKKENWAEIEAEHYKNQNKKARNFNKITEEVKSESIKLYKEGFTLEEISQKLHCSRSPIHRLLHKQENWDEIEREHKINSGRKLLTPDMKNNIINQYRKGHTIREIAKKHGVSNRTVIITLEESSNYEQYKNEHYNNYNKSNKKKFTFVTPELIKDFEKEYANGKKLSEIAKKFGCGREIITKIINSLPNSEEIKELHHKNTAKEDKLDNNAILELYKKGFTQEEIKSSLKCSNEAISEFLKSFKNDINIKNEHITNYNLRTNRLKITRPEIIEQISNLRASGKTIRQIAEITKINSATIGIHLKKYNNTTDIETKYLQNRVHEKNRIIEDIIKQYEAGASIEQLSKEHGFAKSTISTIINIKENNLKFTETTNHKYTKYTLEELHSRIVEFFVKNNQVDETIVNIIDFLDSQESFFNEENKELLIAFCQDLDKIELLPDPNSIIENSTSIAKLTEYINNEVALKNIQEKLGTIFDLLAKNQLLDSYEYFEALVPSKQDNKESFAIAKALTKTIFNKLENPTIENKVAINNLITFNYFASSTEDDDVLVLENAINHYNSIYKETIEIDDIESEDDKVKESIGQIINITKALEGTPINIELANEYKEFIDIFKGKAPLKNKSIKALVALNDYFNTQNEGKYLLKNFEPIARDSILDEEVMRVFMDKFYKFEYKDIGPDKISITLNPSVLKDTNWQRLQPKDQANFIKTMEYGIIERSSKSQGKYNVIKYEGKVKEYQIVELKIDSKWRIFGYQDPKNSKKFILDSIGEDGKGLEKYKKDFFKSHNL